MPQRCVDGHSVPDGFRFCGVCFSPLANEHEAELVPAAPDVNAPVE